MVGSYVETRDTIHKVVDLPSVLSTSMNGSRILLVTWAKKLRVTCNDPFLLNRSANPLAPLH